MKVAFYVAYTDMARTGHGVYQEALLDGLLSQARHSVAVVAREGDPLPEIPAPHSVVRYQRLPGVQRHNANRLAVRVRAAAAVRSVKPDVLIANGNWTMPSPWRIPRVVVAYEGLLDAAPWGTYAPTFTREFTRLTTRSLRGARAIVAISQDTARAAKEINDTCEVVVALPAVPAFPAALAPNPLAGSRYVLSIGWFHPRKDLPLGLAGWRVAMEQGLDRDLVLVGDFGPPDPASGSVGRCILDTVGRELGRRIRCLGSVPRDVLGAVLTDADALLVTSLHEGFGIPVLEAFSLGTPVVAVARGALPEACGDVGVLVAPDAAAVAAGLATAVAQPTPAAELQRYAAGFTREAQLRPVLDLLDRLERSR